jgi:hypothetical protein
MKKVLPILLLLISVASFGQLPKLPIRQVIGLPDSLLKKADTNTVKDIIRNDTTFSPVFYTYRVGDDGAPAEGDSVVTSASFAHKFIKVYRNGLLQYWDTYSGVTYDSATGAITAHGPFVNGEYVLIEGRVTSNDSAVGVNGVLGYGTGGGTSYDADAQAYFDAEATAGNVMSTADKNAWNTFVTGLKSDGIWTHVTQMQFLAHGSFAKDKINVKSPGTLDFTSSNGTITYSTSGETGNESTGYINTGLNPSTSFGSANIFISTYSRTNSSSITFDAGCGDNTLASQVMIASGWGTARTRIDDDVVTVDVATTSLGFFVGDRTSSTLLTLYKNGSSIGTNTTSATHGLPNKTVFLHAFNDNGSGAILNTNRQLTFYSTGTHLTSTQVGNFNTRVETLMDYYGIGVQ